MDNSVLVEIYVEEKKKIVVKRTFGIRESNSVGFLLLPHERRLLRNLSDGAFYPHLIRASPLTPT